VFECADCSCDGGVGEGWGCHCEGGVNESIFFWGRNGRKRTMNETTTKFHVERRGVNPAAPVTSYPPYASNLARICPLCHMPFASLMPYIDGDADLLCALLTWVRVAVAQTQAFASLLWRPRAVAPVHCHAIWIHDARHPWNSEVAGYLWVLACDVLHVSNFQNQRDAKSRQQMCLEHL
jgi:hypothetical protein